MTITTTPDSTTITAPVVSARKSKGGNIQISFHDTTGAESPTGLWMRCKLVAANKIINYDLAKLLNTHPTVAMQILILGAKTIAANSMNTADDPATGEAVLLARFAAWDAGSYTAGSQSFGTPLFIRAIGRALENASLGTPESRQTVMDRWLADYRSEGKFDSLPPEAAAKELKRHQSAIRTAILKKAGIKEAMAELQAESAGPATESISDLLA
jgi:hypothetical protein